MLATRAVNRFYHSSVPFVCNSKFLYFNRTPQFLYTLCIIMISLWIFWSDSTGFVVMCLKTKKKCLFYFPCVSRILAFIHLSLSCKPYVTYVSHLSSWCSQSIQWPPERSKKACLCSWCWTQISYILIFWVAFKDFCLTSEVK